MKKTIIEKLKGQKFRTKKNGQGLKLTENSPKGKKKVEKSEMVTFELP